MKYTTGGFFGDRPLLFGRCFAKLPFELRHAGRLRQPRRLEVFLLPVLVRPFRFRVCVHALRVSEVALGFFGGAARNACELVGTRNTVFKHVEVGRQGVVGRCEGGIGRCGCRLALAGFGFAFEGTDIPLRARMIDRFECSLPACLLRGLLRCECRRTRPARRAVCYTACGLPCPLQGTGRQVRQGFEVGEGRVGGLLRHRPVTTAQQPDREHTGFVCVGGCHRPDPPFACLVYHCDELARNGDRLRPCGLRLRGKLCRHCLRRVCRFQDFRRETLFGTLRREAAFELCKRVALGLNQLV